MSKLLGVYYDIDEHQTVSSGCPRDTRMPRDRRIPRARCSIIAENATIDV